MRTSKNEQERCSRQGAASDAQLLKYLDAWMLRGLEAQRFGVLEARRFDQREAWENITGKTNW